MWALQPDVALPNEKETNDLDPWLFNPSAL